MKVEFLRPVGRTPKPNADAGRLHADLDMAVIIDHMAAGDRHVAEVAAAELSCTETDPSILAARLSVLVDAAAHPQAFRELLQISYEAKENQRGLWGWMSRSPGNVLSHAVRRLEALLPSLIEIRRFADRWHSDLQSQPMRDFITSIETDLDDVFFAEVGEHLRRFGTASQVVATAEIGAHGQMVAHTVRRPERDRRSVHDYLDIAGRRMLSYTLHPRDDAGAQALEALRDIALVDVARALGHAADHVAAFFADLRWDAAYVVGCLNFKEALSSLGLTTRVPKPVPEPHTWRAQAVYDPALALRAKQPLVTNDLLAEGVTKLILTGANQGGKSTFLRALGLAQVLMQGGCFVAASHFEGSMHGPVHTHFRQAEDGQMKHGKLDEELMRISDIIDNAGPGDLVLMNEPFTSTNEQEAMEIGREIIDGLAVAGLTVAAVTHNYSLARAYVGTPGTQFLQPERRDDGVRTYRLLPLPPADTGHALDVYRRVFVRPGPVGA